MFKEKLTKKDPCLENFGPQNPPIREAHTCTSTCYVSSTSLTSFLQSTKGIIICSDKFFLC